MGIEEYIIKQGYKPFRQVDGKLIPEEESGISSYSTMVKGGIQKIYTKEGSPNIYYGLSEYGKPPTLIEPRPCIELKMLEEGKYYIMNEQSDDAVNRCLREEPVEEVYKAMFDRSIEFNYSDIDYEETNS